MLLDTHTALWFAEGVLLSPEVVRDIDDARRSGAAYISAASVWEVGILCRKRRIAVLPSLSEWVRSFVVSGGFEFIDVTVEIVIESDRLPAPIHEHPADRFLVATARLLGVPIVTRDRRILDYADTGHVQALAC